MYFNKTLFSQQMALQARNQMKFTSNWRIVNFPKKLLISHTPCNMSWVFWHLAWVFLNFFFIILPPSPKCPPPPSPPDSKGESEPDGGGVDHHSEVGVEEQEPSPGQGVLRLRDSISLTTYQWQSFILYRIESIWTGCYSSRNSKLKKIFFLLLNERKNY